MLSSEQVMDNKLGKTRLGWLDLLRGIAITLVVLGHVYNGKLVFDIIYSFHMPLFFFIAGCLYKQKPFFDDIKRRIWTIVVPYFSFGILTLVYWFMVERYYRYSNLTITQGLFGLIFGRYKYLDFNIPLWFLPCFFMTTVIYNAICIVLNRKIVYVITIAVSIIYPITTISSVDCFWQLNSVCWYIGFYALGNLFMDNEMDLIILSKTRWINVMIAVLLAISDFILCYFELNIGIVRWFGATMGIFAFTIISLLIGRCKCIEYLGRISLVILCVHGLVYRFWIKIISLLIKMEVDFLRGKFWCSIVVVVVTLMTCAAVYEVLKRTAPWMLGKRIN